MSGPLSGARDVLLSSSVVHARPIEAEVLAACLRPEWIDDGFVKRIDRQIIADTLPSEAFRQLPYLGTVAPELPFSDPSWRVIRSMQRHTLARSLVHLTLVSRTAEALHERGLPVVALKGLPLLDTVYPGPATRPSADGDLLLIGGEPFEVYAPVLEELGWRCRYHGREGNTSQWRGPSGAEIDVHRFLRDWFCAPSLRSEFVADWHWVQGERVRLPVPPVEALLFHVLLHGGLFSPTDSNTRWVLDAALLLRQNPDLDWRRVLDLAHAHRWVAPVARAIRLLSTLEETAEPADLDAHVAAERLPLQARLARARWLGRWLARPAFAHRLGTALGARSLDYMWGWQFDDHAPPAAPGGRTGYLGHLERQLETSNPFVGAVRLFFGGQRLR